MRNKNKLYFLVYSFFAGIIDVIMPNVEKSIKEVKSEFYDDPPQLHINWIRILTAATTLVLLVLNFCRIIRLEDLQFYIELLKK